MKLALIWRRKDGLSHAYNLVSSLSQLPPSQVLFNPQRVQSNLWPLNIPPKAYYVYPPETNIFKQSNQKSKAPTMHLVWRNDVV